ncbi:unnamed protein product [marine sediment metagenome]|uniref:Ribbon-helix-helix protein CopG domain-containing protein n=1 Tax=marine sediment metagenome TaxID=412755 RepID=X1M3C3_9ZZZZ
MPRPKTLELAKDYTDVLISVKINQAQKKQLDKLADETGRSQSELVREAIMALLGVYYGTATKDALAETLDKGVARRKH